jgi:large subunit ribosomal protein L3
MKFILGTKEYMTQMFDEQGNAYPVTVLAARPNIVTQIKKADGADKYTAIQIAGAKKKEKARAPKKEFRCPIEDTSKLKVGDEIKVDAFAAGDIVEVSGITKAKGFQGVVKRHGFHGGPRSHGQKHCERAPGSLGAGGVQRVFKGMRMAGRMGGVRATVKNIKVLRVDPESGEMYLRGAVPGRRGTLVEVKSK